jgi:phage gp29-like protein
MRASVIPETDFFAWTQDQAVLLRARRGDAIDWDNLAEEIESVGRRDRRELGSRLKVILLHQLKWQFQPGRRGSSWRSSLRAERQEIDALLKQSPSLRREVVELMVDAYDYALDDAEEQTKLPRSSFPGSCPYTPEQVLDRHYLPEAERDRGTS